MTEIPKNPEQATGQPTNQGEDIFDRVVHKSVVRGSMGASAIPTRDTIGVRIVQESILLFRGKIIATRGEIDEERR